MNENSRGEQFLRERMRKPAHNITHCMRCGTCCMKGGPVLHHEDKKILRSGRVGYEHLITIRKGEPAYNPIHGKLERVIRDIIKVAGKGEDWACYFYDEKDAACSIYGQHFLECRLLKCWDTAEIIRVIGRGTLCRADIINQDDPILRVIEEHERECPADELENLIAAASAGSDKKKTFARLGELVAKDVSMRAYAISELGLKAEYELFIFGHPLSKLLANRGLAVLAPEGNICLNVRPSSDR